MGRCGSAIAKRFRGLGVEHQLFELAHQLALPSEIGFHQRTGLQLTPRWREQDSNRRSRVTRPIFQLSPLVGSPPTEKSERKRTDTRSVGPFPRGTDGSNPVPSSEESCANPVLPAIAANLFEPEDIG